MKRESLWVGESIIPEGCEAKEGCMGMEMQGREKGEWACALSSYGGKQLRKTTMCGASTRDQTP